jgi:hypothetical protein
MNASEVATVWDFQRRTGARSVKFGASHMSAGFAAPASTACSSAAGALSLTADAPLGVSGVKATASPQYDGIWR